MKGKKLYRHIENVDFILIKQFYCNIPCHCMDSVNFVIL